ncbi:SDR family oxidoreductase [Ascidiimonas sp. W6]|uniref:SDR family oxidoreductase n=1 Tax=Ascidiimonas meishanensis TaxID=3128903 RepID=UPI0030EBF3B2
MNKSIAILGCGWLGLPLATSLIKEGSQVKGSTTSQNKLSILDSAAILPFLIEVNESGIEGDITNFIDGVHTLIVDIPPKLRRNSSANFVAKIKHVISAVKNSNITHLIFVSSTSVYGNLTGKITEQTLPIPQTESGKQLLESEKLLKKETSFNTTILRFAGLIGQDRHPVTYLSGKQDIKHPNAFVNLIHQEDCINIIKQLIAQEPLGKTYNAAYPLHPSKEVYYTNAALKRNIPPPQYESSPFTGKYIDSSFLTEDLNYHFQKDINL